jgi:phosphonopyruvate decarboxylase
MSASKRVLTCATAAIGRRHQAAIPQSAAAAAKSALVAAVQGRQDNAFARGFSSGGEERFGHRPMTETVRTFLKADHFLHLLKAYGTTFYTGVPDSLLANLIGYISDNVEAENHMVSPNEGTALATASGHYLATGNIPCVYLQNSGLGNLANPLLSLCSTKVYSIPVLMIMGWRGEPGKKDEPQHQLQGAITPGMLETMGVPYDILPDYAEGAFDVLQKAYETMNKTKGPFVLLVKKQTFEPYQLQSHPIGFTGVLHREEILERIIDVFPTSPIVSTTGFTSRELFELRVAKGQSHENDFLTVGSMGHASSIALGIAQAQPEREVICVDGDGAALMHMGAIAATGRSGHKGYKHILVNNALHDSVGGQSSGGLMVDFAAIARACGYPHVDVANSAAEVEQKLRDLKAADGPCFLEVRAGSGARSDLGRPTTSTVENKDAFMAMLSTPASA